MPPDNHECQAKERYFNHQGLCNSTPDHEMKVPPLQNADLDHEDEAGDIVPGSWRDDVMMAEVEDIQRGPRETRPGKLLRTHLKFYYNSSAGSVPWQR